MKFDDLFAEPIGFTPEGIHISRRAFNRDQAAAKIREVFQDDYPDPIDPDDLIERSVRFGPTGQMESEMGCKLAWMVCPEGTRGSQPTWQF